MCHYILIGISLLIGWSASAEDIERFSVPVCFQILKDDVWLCDHSKPVLRCASQCSEIIRLAEGVFEAPIEITPTTPISNIHAQLELRETYLHILVGIAVRPEHPQHTEAVQAIKNIKSSYLKRTMEKLSSNNNFTAYCAAIVLTGRSTQEYPMTILLLSNSQILEKAETVKSRIHNDYSLRHYVQEDFLTNLKLAFNKAHALMNNLDALRNHKYNDMQSLENLNVVIGTIVSDIEKSMNAIVVHNEYFTYELPKYDDKLKGWVQNVVKLKIDEFNLILQSEISTYTQGGSLYAERLNLSEDDIAHGIETLMQHVNRVNDAFKEVETSLNLNEWIAMEYKRFEWTGIDNAP